MQALKINTWRAVTSLLVLLTKKRKFGPLKDCEGPQKCDIKGPNDPWQFLFILTPVCNCTLHQNLTDHIESADFILVLAFGFIFTILYEMNA